MKLSLHAQLRAKEREIDIDILKEFKRHFNTISYNIRTKTFFVLAKQYMILYQDWVIKTIYKRDKLTHDRLVYKNLMKIKRHLRPILKKYILLWEDLTLNEYRTLKKYYITIWDHEE